jgi:hypothetical protein
MKRPARVLEKPARGRAVCTLAALILAFAAANGWSQEPAKPAAEPAPPATEAKPDASAPPAEKTSAPAEAPASTTPTPAASTPAPATTEGATAEGEKAPERFIPTQKSSADNSATFPIDI